MFVALTCCVAPDCVDCLYLEYYNILHVCHEGRGGGEGWEITMAKSSKKTDFPPFSMKQSWIFPAAAFSGSVALIFARLLFNIFLSLLITPE